MRGERGAPPDEAVAFAVIPTPKLLDLAGCVLAAAVAVDVGFVLVPELDRKFCVPAGN